MDRERSNRRGTPAWIRWALLSTLTAAAWLPGCGGGGGITGTYVAEETSPEGDTMRFALELRGDGEAVLTLTGPGGQGLPPVRGTYTVEGDKVKTRLDGDEDVMTWKPGSLTMDFFGEQVVLRKR